MAPGSSYKLTALLLTKAISYATNTLRTPLWVLFLDKKATFDSVLKEHVINFAFSASGHHGNPLICYLASSSFLLHSASTCPFSISSRLIPFSNSRFLSFKF